MSKAATSIAQLRAIAEGAKQNGAKFTSQLRALNQNIEKKQIEIQQKIEMAGSIRKATATQHYEGEFGDWIRTYRKENEPARYAILKEIVAAESMAAYARTEMSDPRKAATMHGIGTEERSRLEKSLEKMGGASLLALAKRAEIEGDKNLAAAVILQNDTLARNSRLFESSALAESVFGPECKQVRELCGQIKREVDAATQANRIFDGQKLANSQRIENGLNHGEGRLLQTEAEPEKPMTNIEKMMKGIAVELYKSPTA